MKKLLLFCILILICLKFTIACDWKVEIISDNIFPNVSSFEFKYKIMNIYGNKTNITLIRSIEDVYGEIIEDYSNYTKEVTTQHTKPTLSPNLEEEAYLIKGEIFPDCNDTDLSNNLAESLIIILKKQTSQDFYNIKISELMPNPYGDDDAPMSDGEWVELYNEGNNDLDLKEMKLYDNIGVDPDIIISSTNTLTDTIIKGKGYLTIYMNGRYGFLNNDDFEKISLYKNDTLIDEVTYSGSKEGESWAKVNGIWQQTIPTPGDENRGNSTETSTSLEIKEVYVGSDEKAKFGDTLSVAIEVYKGNSTRTSVQLWLEGTEEISKKTKTNLEEKFTNYKLTLPIQLLPNCNYKYPNGTYTIVLEGLGERDEEEVKIEGITKNLCEVVKTTNEKEISYELIEPPKEAYSGEEIEIKIRIMNKESKKETFEVWSYVYGGNIYASDGKDTENMQEVTLFGGSSAVLGLKNKIKEGLSSGDYGLKVKVKKQELKTPVQLTSTIKINPQKISKEKPLTAEINYSASNIKAKSKAVYFFVAGLVLIVVELVRRKV